MQDIYEKQPLWSKFKNNFLKIIEKHEYYNRIFKFLNITNNNALLFGCSGFPTDEFLDELLKYRFKLLYLHKQECVWKKDIPYLHNQHFLEIDLLNPSMTKNLNQISDFLKNIINTKHINNTKHCIIIKHIDMLSQSDFNSFRIILERYSNNAFFFCTTLKLDKIDVPIKSRFDLIRMPLFQNIEICDIFNSYLDIELNKYLKECKTRDIIKSIFIAEVELINPSLITKEFCTFHFPPLYDFIKTFTAKKSSLDSIKKISYQCFQYNVTIPLILDDLLKIMPKKKKIMLIEKASYYDAILNKTNKGREPLYIEAFLCNVLL